MIGFKARRLLSVTCLFLLRNGRCPPLALALEPRFVFDAAGPATAEAQDSAAFADDVAAAPDPAQDQAPADEGPAGVSAEAPESPVPPAEESRNGLAPAAPDADQTSDAGPEAAAALAEPTYQVLREADPSQTGGRREVAFIDTGVADYQTLVDGVKPGVEVVLLDGTGDGLAQMAAWAEGKSGYDAVHVLSHGAEGQVRLGTLTLDTAAAETRAADLATLGGTLTADGDLLLYGCEVASGVCQACLETWRCKSSIQPDGVKD